MSVTKKRVTLEGTSWWWYRSHLGSTWTSNKVDAPFQVCHSVFHFWLENCAQAKLLRWQSPSDPLGMICSWSVALKKEGISRCKFKLQASRKCERTADHRSSALWIWAITIADRVLNQTITGEIGQNNEMLRFSNVLNECRCRIGKNTHGHA